MWNDIDYMDRRRVFTNDPARFPLEKVRELVDYLHDHDQHYIVMVDPAVSASSKYLPSSIDTGIPLTYSRQFCVQKGPGPGHFY